MKAYTDLERSKKLAEILPIESADMCYIQDLLAGGKYGKYQPYIGDLIPAYGQDKIKCWSLAALLSMIDTVKEIQYHRVTMLVGKYAGNNWYIELQKIQDERSALLVYSKELIDACYEMIIKLNEQKLL